MHHHQRWTWILCVSRFLVCLAAITSLWGCAAPITWQTIQAHNPGAERIDTCIRPPPFGGRGEFYTYNETTHEMVSDEDAEAFWEAARTAGAVYRYDPNAPSDPGPRLPWPYHRMTCDEVSSGDVPPLPKGMKEIPISRQMREAMVRALTAPGLRVRTAANHADKPPPAMVGQVLLIPPQPVDYKTAIEELGQMFRDAARDKLPKVKRQGAGPSDAEISIIDTQKGQIIGGFGTGLGFGTLPGGTFVASALAASDQKPTREFMLAEGLGEMASGGVQVGVGTGMAAGGGGLSLTGGGALVGVPTCTAGVALAANGAVTFINGGRKVIVALCHWNELPAAPSAAAANTAGSTSAASAASTAPTSGASGGAAAKPAATAAASPSPGAKPAPAPAAKPPTSPTPPQSEPTLHLGKHLGSGKKSSPNTTTWVRCTGQKHHAISKEIHGALQRHQVLKDVYQARDNRFVTQAIDKSAHKGYQTWHRNYETQVEDWLRVHNTATPAEFEAYLFDLYKTDNALNWRFPNGL